MLDRMTIMKKLLATGVIDRETLIQIKLACQNRQSITLKVLANYTKMSTSEIRTFFEKHFNMPKVDLNSIVLNPEIVNLVPADVALTHLIVPAFRIVDKTHLAVSNPLDLDGLEEICKYTGEKCSIFLSPEDQVITAINNSRKSQARKYDCENNYTS